LAMGCPDSSMTCPLIEPCAAPSICACARVAAHRAQSTSAQMTSARPGRLAKRGRGRGMIAVQRRLKLRRRILSVVERDLYLAAVGYVDERALSGLASLRGQADERQFVLAGAEILDNEAPEFVHLCIGGWEDVAA